eukprot:superscaffoldBa00000423_g4626
MLLILGLGCPWALISPLPPSFLHHWVPQADMDPDKALIHHLLVFWRPEPDLWKPPRWAHQLRSSYTPTAPSPSSASPVSPTSRVAMSACPVGLQVSGPAAWDKATINCRAVQRAQRGGRQQFPPDGPRSLPRGHSPRLATSCLTSLRRAEHAGLWITRAGHKQSYFLSRIECKTERSPARPEQGQGTRGWWSEGTALAWSSEDLDLPLRRGDEQLFTGAEPGAVSGSALTTGDQAGQLGQAPAASRRSESESSRAH